MSLNEIIYEFKVKKILSLLHDRDQSLVNDISARRLKYRVEATNATAFANVKVKIYYDVRHTSLLLNLDDRAYLKLNHEYQLSSKSNRKIFSQRCDLFLVKRRVDRLAYELELSNNWNIHLVVSIAQLKSHFVIANPYNRSRSNHFETIEMKGDTSRWRSWEVERIVDKRIRKYDNKNVTQYQIHWKGYDSKHDVWRSIIKLDNCMNLVEKYETRVRVEQKFRDIHQFMFARQRRQQDRRSRFFSISALVSTIQASGSATTAFKNHTSITRSPFSAAIHTSTLDHSIVLIKQASRSIIEISQPSISFSTIRRSERLRR